MRRRFGFVAVCAAGLLLLGVSGCVTDSGGEKGPRRDPAAEYALPVIGQEEQVTIFPETKKLRYPARIDTGATTCSISALGLERFERDGKKWVRFRLPAPAGKSKEIPVELPVVRDVPIKRHGAPDQIRPAVELPIKLGPVQRRVEFTLTDRSKYTYPVLIGRNLLEGYFVVDVSRKNIADKAARE